MGTDRSGCQQALGLSPRLNHTQVTGRSGQGPDQGAGASQAPPPFASPAGLGKRPLILLQSTQRVEGKALRCSNDTPWVRYWARCFAVLRAFSSHNSAKHIESPAWHGCRNQVKVNRGCEGDLAATSVTPSSARVGWAELAGWAGVPSSLTVPQASLPKPQAGCSIKDSDLPQRRGWSSVKGVE